MSRYDDIIEDIDVIEELEGRGIEGRSVGDNLMVCCPYHGEKNPSFGIAFKGKNKGRFNCFSCHQTGNFFHLIAFLDNEDFEDAIRKYKKDFVVDSSMIDEMKLQFVSGLKNKEEQSNGKIRVMDKSVLDLFKKPYGKFKDYLIGEKRKLDEDDIEKWGILCCDRDFEERKLYWNNRVVVPMYDTKERLISVMARSILNDEKIDKVRKIKGGERKKILFGLQFIERGAKLVLVEGEFDCIYLQKFGIPAVSIGTTYISDIQLKKIIKFTDSVALSLDGDTKRLFNKKTGKNIRTEAYERLSRFIGVDVLQLPIDLDPNDMNEKQIEKLYSRFKGGLI